jgi:hypothetical protein
MPAALAKRSVAKEPVGDTAERRIASTLRVMKVWMNCASLVASRFAFWIITLVLFFLANASMPLRAWAKWGLGNNSITPIVSGLSVCASAAVATESATTPVKL